MIDDHAHPFSATFEPLDLAQVSLDVEPGAYSRRAALGPGRLFQELLGGRLAALLGRAGEGTPTDQIVAERDAVAGPDWPGWVRRLLDDAGIEALVFDPGLDPGADPTGPPGAPDYAALAARPVRNLLRVDPVVDRLLAAGAGAAEVVAGVEEVIEHGVAHGAVGLKTILAYRTGLAVDPDADLRTAQAGLDPAIPIRRRGKALRDLVFLTTLARAGDHHLPVQVHTGFGDGEIRLAEADPTLLEEALRSRAGRGCDVVLIHGSFPWIDAAAYLATVRPNVYAELSLANLFAPLHTADRLARLLDLAPRDKVLLGTDGHGPPETHWFAAQMLTEGWRHCRQRLAEAGAGAGWLADTEAAIFTQNARRLYRLG